MKYEDPVHMMELTGGSFVRSLAECYYRADKYNSLRLRNAFPDVFERYETLFRAEQGKQEQA